MEYKISLELANSILRYLGSRPYAEVVDLIKLLQKIEPIEEEKQDGPAD